MSFTAQIRQRGSGRKLQKLISHPENPAVSSRGHPGCSACHDQFPLGQATIVFKFVLGGACTRLCPVVAVLASCHILIFRLGRRAHKDFSYQDMGVVAGVVFCTTLLLQLAVVSLCTLWPIKHDLALLTTPHGWRQLYSLANSNLDVWVLSTIACLANIVCLASIANFSLKRQTSHKAPAYKIVQVLVAVLALLSQVCSKDGSS